MAIANPRAVLFSTLLCLSGAAGAQISLVTEFGDGAENGKIVDLAPLNGFLYVLKEGRFIGTELWATDGRSKRLIKEILTESVNSLHRLVATTTHLYFETRADQGIRRLWATDGTPEGTQMVASTQFAFTDLTPWGHELVYIDGGLDMYLSDGTSQGTRLLGWDPGAFANVTDITPYGGRLLFVSNFRIPDDKDPLNKTKHVRSIVMFDPKATGEKRFQKMVKGNESPHPTGLAVFDRTVYFNGIGEQTGRDLWYLAGDTLGQFMDQVPASFSSDPADMTVVGDRMFFWANVPVEAIGDNVRKATRELFSTEGLAVEQMTQNFEGGLGVARGTRVGDQYLFVASQVATGREIWISDGTAAGTRLLKDISPGFAHSDPRNFLPLGSRRTWFLANDGEHGKELWVTDGTSDGTRMVQDLYPGKPDSHPERLVHYDGKIYFIAKTRDTGRELFSVDPGAVSVSVGQSWSDQGSPVGLHVSDVVPGTDLKVESTTLPKDSLFVPILGFPGDTPVEIEPGMFSYLDLLRPIIPFGAQIGDGRSRYQGSIPVPPNFVQLENLSIQGALLGTDGRGLMGVTNQMLLVPENH